MKLTPFNAILLARKRTGGNAGRQHGVGEDIEKVNQECVRRCSEEERERRCGRAWRLEWVELLCGSFGFVTKLFSDIKVIFSSFIILSIERVWIFYLCFVFLCFFLNVCGCWMYFFCLSICFLEVLLVLLRVPLFCYCFSFGQFTGLIHRFSRFRYSISLSVLPSYVVSFLFKLLHQFLVVWCEPFLVSFVCLFFYVLL